MKRRLKSIGVFTLQLIIGFSIFFVPLCLYILFSNWLGPKAMEEMLMGLGAIILLIIIALALGTLFVEAGKMIYDPKDKND